MNTNDYTRSERTTIGRAWAWLEHMVEKSGHSEADLLERAYLIDRGSRGSFLTSKAVLIACAYNGMVSRGQFGVGVEFNAPGCVLAYVLGMRLGARKSGENYSDDFSRFSGHEMNVDKANKSHTARLVAKVTSTPYQPKTGAACSCRPGVARDNCPACEGTGMVIDFAAIRAGKAAL